MVLFVVDEVVCLVPSVFGDEGPKRSDVDAEIEGSVTCRRRCLVKMSASAPASPSPSMFCNAVREHVVVVVVGAIVGAVGAVAVATVVEE